MNEKLDTKTTKHLYLLFLTLFAIQAQAFNRIDAAQQIAGIEASWAGNKPDVWINDFRIESDPGLAVGGDVTIFGESAVAGHFLFILVDSKGAISLFRPLTTQSSSYQEISGLVQDVPVGDQFLYALIANEPFDAAILQTDPVYGYQSIGRDEAEFERVTRAISDHASLHRVGISDRFSYFVDDPDVKLATRGMRIGVKKQLGTVTPENTQTAEVEQPVAPKAEEPEPANAGSADGSGLALDIKFAFNDAALTENGMRQLDVLGSVLLSLMEDDAIQPLVLVGHTDDVGDWNYNLQLSQKRAESARQYLVDEFDLPDNAIQSSGSGEGDPIVSNQTAEGQSINRRVELKVAE